MLSWRRLCLGLDLVAFPITTTIYLSMRAYSLEGGRYLGRMLGAREEGKGKGERGGRRPWSFEFLASFAPATAAFLCVASYYSIYTHQHHTTTPTTNWSWRAGRHPLSLCWSQRGQEQGTSLSNLCIFIWHTHTHTHTQRERERGRERGREMPRGTKQIPSRHVMSTTYRPGRTLDQSQRTFAFPSDTFVLFSQSSSNSLCVPVTSA